MQNIQPVTIWYNGKLETATTLEVVSVYDNLATTADLRYTLYTADKINVSSERLTISGEDYLIWGVSADINLAAYQWVAAQLNLIIDYTVAITTILEVPAEVVPEEPIVINTESSTTIEEPITPELI